jgi:hypothetical protein
MLTAKLYKKYPHTPWRWPFWNASDIPWHQTVDRRQILKWTDSRHTDGAITFLWQDAIGLEANRAARHGSAPDVLEQLGAR